MIARISGLPHGDPLRERLREQLVELHLPYIHAIARRYAHRGEPLEDVLQAGCLGLAKALNGFDPSVGERFLPYAAATISGQIKHHFRDTTWTVRVSRRTQEQRPALRALTAEFTAAFERAPTITECAILLDVTEDEIIDVLHSDDAYSPLSLDARAGLGSDVDIALGDRLGYEEAAFDNLVDLESLQPLLNGLPSRDRTILLLRFWGNQTQDEIAERMHLSQMHISRILRRTLTQLRDQLTGDLQPH
jgi:RNA polymerase sigma-B factor